MSGRIRRRRRRSYLNPAAPEFHPLFFHPSFYSTTTNNNNNTRFTSINCYYNYNYYHPNYYHLNFPYYSTLPSLPPSSVVLPQNYQNYPYHHQGFINQPSPTNPMQLPPPWQLGQLPTAPTSAHFSSGPSPVWPKIPAIGRSEDGGGGGARGRSRSRRRDIININNNNNNNSERKQGFDTSNMNDNERRNIRSNLGGERKKEDRVVMAVKPIGTETTAMIRNIPNQYTREMLIKFLDEFCRIENQRLSPNDDRQPLAYDFLYLPIDFVRGANKGYAFVNFTHAIAVWKLHLACSNQPWSHCNSPKICKINYASIQGKERLEEHFGRSRFICNHDDYLPVCFSPPRDGSGASVAETTIGTRVSSSSHPRN